MSDRFLTFQNNNLTITPASHILGRLHSPARTGVPSVGKAVPQALTMTPEQAVEDAVKEPVEVEALYVWLPPDPL